MSRSNKQFATIGRFNSRTVMNPNNITREVEDELTCKSKELAKDGFWIVPPSERMKGWEKMGLKEREE